MPPPTTRKSASGTVAVGPKVGGEVLLYGRIEHGEDFVAWLEHRVGPRDEPGSLAQDRDQQAALRHLEVADPLAGGLGVGRQQHLDDLEALFGQVEQVDETV